MDPSGDRPGLREIAMVIPDSIRFSHDGRYLALVDRKPNQFILCVFQLADGAADGDPEIPQRELGRWQLDTAATSGCVALASGAKRVAVGYAGQISVIDPHSGHKIVDLTPPDNQPVRDVALDETGNLLAWVTEHGRRASLWDVASSELLARVEPDGAGQLLRVALSPSGRWLAVGDGNARLTVVDLNRVADELRAAKLGWNGKP